MFNNPQGDLWFHGLFIVAMLLSAVIARWLMHSVPQDVGQRLPPLKTRTLMLIAACAGLAALPFSLSPLQRISLLPVATLLLALALIDWRHRLLPDRLTQPLLWAGLLANQQGCFTSLDEAVIGAVAGYLSLWWLNALYRLQRKTEGIGQGDFKLLAALGAWSGWSAHVGDRRSHGRLMRCDCGPFTPQPRQRCPAAVRPLSGAFRLVYPAFDGRHGYHALHQGQFSHFSLFHPNGGLMPWLALL